DCGPVGIGKSIRYAEFIRAVGERNNAECFGGLMSDLDKFHSDATPSAAMLELIEISHPLWPKPLRYVTNHADGVTVKHENGLVYNYEFMPVQINKGTTSDDLDQNIKVTVGDLGQVVPQLLKIIRDANNFER